jgi:hypothetical protein
LVSLSILVRGSNTPLNKFATKSDEPGRAID